MTRLILSRMVLYGISHLEMAAALCMSERTFRRRLQKPEEFTLSELKKTAKKLRMTVNDLIGIAA